MSTTNTNLTFKGNPMPVEGMTVATGTQLPAFTLVGNDMSPVTNATVAGKVVVLSLVPSLDTPTCSIETARFNQEASEFGNQAVVLTASADLPFAQARWCAAEGAKNVLTASSYKNTKEFGGAFGAYIPAMALLARAVFVADKSGVVQHVEYVSELSQEPDYQAIMKKVRELL